jgi:FtsH-binding integral membrane protein
MIDRPQIEAWIRARRPALAAGWAALGVVVVGALLLGPEAYLLKGAAPWPRGWAIAFFLSLWAWVALRFIALWIWAWVVMALAPLCLFIPLRFYLEAPWLQPLLIAIILVSVGTVVAVVWRERRRRRSAH